MEEELFPHDNNGDDASSDFVSLDEEGFPSQVPDDVPNRIDEGSEMASGKSSFATDFYRCGTDWSCLLLPEDSGRRLDYEGRDFKRDSKSSEKKLKQANLFQIWGFKRNDASESVSASHGDSEFEKSGFFDDGDEGKKNAKAENWGSILDDNQTDLGNSRLIRKRKHTHEDNRTVRACPFYKKMPGESSFISHLPLFCFFFGKCHWHFLFTNCFGKSCY